MQLTTRGIAATLGMMAGALLGGSPAAAQVDAAGPSAQPFVQPPGQPSIPNAYDETASEAGTFVADSALLFYQEDAGRVRAIESETGLTWNAASGLSVSGKFVYDSLTGATPNGAVRSYQAQTFTPPRKREAKNAAEARSEPATAEDSDATTGASGMYTIKRGRLPVDAGFKDHRSALDLGVTVPVADGLKVSLGGSASWETDYTSYSGRAGLAKELFSKNTTLSLGLSYGRDSSKPFSGIPRPLGSMGDYVIGTGRSKTITSVIAGITQVISPGWLAQLNWSHGEVRGYQTDPYKLVSLVDSASGDPFAYIYESRPGRRTRDSVYAGTKFALGSLVTDASVRWYRDSWGINSWTYALSEHLPLGRSAYIEPGIRYYRQSAASFFRNYLLLDENTPAFVSADSRLGKFHAWTLGVKAGVRVAPNIEVYGAAERYMQEGQRFDRTAPGSLARTDLFAGSKSVSLITGVRMTFR